MTLRRKTLTVIGMTFLGLMVILYLVSRNILLDSFAELEEYDTRQDVGQVLSALSVERSGLGAVAGDWSEWDDTYAFIEDANNEYIRSNLVDGTFTGLRLNLMMFIDTSGRTVFGKAFDLNSEKEAPVPQGLQQHLSTGDLLISHPDTESSVTGLILLPDGPMLIASRPILTSEGEGPIRGTLIMGRYLDAVEIERLAAQTHLSLIMHQFTDAQAPQDFQAVSSSLSEEAPIIVRPLDEQSIAGYALLKDIYGQPSLVLRVDVPRDIYQQGQASILYLVLSIVAVSLVFCLVTILLLERQVLSRLARLSKSVSSVGASGDLSARVSITGRDELSSLAGTINGMLAALQQDQVKLGESEEKLRLMFESVAEGIIVTDLDGNMVQVNEAVVRMHGYHDKQELIGRSSFELIAEKDRARAMENMKKTLQDGYARNMEYLLLTKNGEELYGQLSTAALRDESGILAGFVGIARDTTERKRLEKALKESEERYRSFVQNFHGIAYLSDISFTPIFFHGAVEAITGYTEADVTAGKPRWDQIIYPDDLPKVHREVEKLFSTPNCSATGEYRIIRKDGEIRWVRDTIKNVCDSTNRPVLLQGAMYDITERKQTEEEIRRLSDKEAQSAREWQETFDAITDIIAVISPHYRILKVNRAGAEALGKKPEELIGKKCYEAVHGLDGPIEGCPCAETIKTKKSGSGEITERGRYYIATADPILDEGGEIVAFTHTVKDITERKRAERVLQERNERLDAQNEELQLQGEELLAQQQELMEKSRELEAASQAKSQFLASMSHELRTPLNVVIGFSELLLDGVPGAINDEQRQCLQDIWSSGRHLLNLINDVLDLSKVEAGKMELKPESLNLVDIINDVAGKVRPMLDDNRQTLAINIEEGLPQVRADRSRLRQILFNLLSNAIKFTPDGGKLAIEVTRQDSWYQVSVVDNGIGLRKEDQGRLFEAFTQLDALPERKKEGAGLGLALTKQLVERGGGKIRLESEYGRGSRFTFTIPVVNSES